ncbi:recombinase family protein [Liquorilactobacillus satsumensis]|uniref:recombinase family protein n=1 Tax=Liquorilactobacillus satsumensis TaxID=259059 RepID=UPI0021C25C4E|nr:recombinase family protein [Liquorilactobacillus satsumensis]MCP9328740.1 recombinase family protein [Liquorilactobacillus satsumensis]
MRIGYLRTDAAVEKGIQQNKLLKKIGAKQFYLEAAIVGKFEKKYLQQLLLEIKEGDELVIASLEHLGQTPRELVKIIQGIYEKGATLDILDLPAFKQAKGSAQKRVFTKLVLEMQEYLVAQEQKMLETKRQVGIELAKKHGIYKGKQVEYAANVHNQQKRLVFELIQRLLAKKARGERISISEIARKAGVTRQTVYNIKRDLTASIKNKRR